MECSARTGRVGDDEYLQITVTCPPLSTNDRAPCDIVCVIDTSGSMQTVASVQGPNGELEDNGLTVLDIVKHAVRTIIEVLQPNDRLGIVSYSSDANTPLPLTNMDASGKQRAHDSVAELRADGQTNIWAGLSSGLDLIQKFDPARMKHVLLLTDGQPNILPPHDHLEMLQRYKQAHPSLASSLSVFGFGYSLDTQLLESLAIEGDGTYAFIPDAAMVGTVFVNTVANSLSTVAQSQRILLVSDDPVCLESCSGMQVLAAEDGSSHQISVSVQADQPRDLVFRVRSANPTTIHVQPVGNQCFDPVSTEIGSPHHAPDSLMIQLLREKTCSTIRGVLTTAGEWDSTRHEEGGWRVKDLESAQMLVDVMVQELRAASCVNQPAVQGLIEDLTGQVFEAISRDDWFERWGCHYLPSLSRAHQLQQCTNFKDPGVQHYGGSLFEHLREQAEDAFNELPAPEPMSGDALQEEFLAALPPELRAQVAAVPAHAAPAAPVDMSSYYCHSNPCFAGCCPVLLADGTTQSIDQLRAGMLVATPSGRAATVEALVRCDCEGFTSQLSDLSNNVLMTPWHPVRRLSENRTPDEAWSFPHDLVGTAIHKCDAVYNLVLSSEHVITVGEGVQAVTLGHGLKGAVVGHTFLGDMQAIQREVQRIGVDESGVVRVRGMKRSYETGLVCGFW